MIAFDLVVAVVEVGMIVDLGEEEVKLWEDECLLQLRLL